MGREKRKEHGKVNVEGMQVDKAATEARSLYFLSHIKVHSVKRSTVWTDAGKENPRGGWSLKQRTYFAG